MFSQALAGSVFCCLGGRRFAQCRIDDLASTTYLHQHHPAACFGMEQLDVELQLAYRILQPSFLEWIPS